MKLGSKLVRSMLLGSALAATAIAAAPANAIVFNLNYTSAGTANDAKALKGFQDAAAFWSSILVGNSTVNLNVGYNTLAAGVIGSTGSTRADVHLADVVGALATHATSTIDAKAVASTAAQLQANGSVNAITSAARNANNNTGVNTAVTEWDNDGSENNSYIWGNTANLKALGITTDFRGNDISNVVDGSITFSNQFKFDFDGSDGIDSDSIDFVGVAIHEIGHALGFVSGVDLYDQYGYPSGPSRTSGNSIDFDNPDGGLMSVLDLFRYSSDANNVAPGTGPVLDWSVARAATIALGGNPYFSFDGGLTQFNGDSRFSTGRYNGDGQQASHWKDNLPGMPQEGVMDPTVAYGQQDVIKGLDLAAFDAMGYNIAYDVFADPTRQFSTQNLTVPEPATWAMMISGFGFIGGSMRAGRRNRKAALAAA